MSEFWQSFFSKPNGQITATIIIVSALIVIFIALRPLLKKLDDFKVAVDLHKQLIVCVFYAPTVACAINNKRMPYNRRKSLL